MSSNNTMPKEVFSERLAELRNSMLVPNENIVAQQMGDTGQAVVLTENRIMILKAGLAATGSIDGQNVTALTFDQLGAVTVRRGPMGSVIQIVGKDTNPSSGVRPPENMAVFNGELKTKKLEAFVEKFSSVCKVAVTRVDWVPSTEVRYPLADAALDAPEEDQEDTPMADSIPESSPQSIQTPSEPDIVSIPQKPQIYAEEEIEFDLDGIGDTDEPVIVQTPANQTSRGRKKKTLAEEIYGEFMESEPETVHVREDTKPEKKTKKAAPEPVAVEAAVEPTDISFPEDSAFAPNPKLALYLAKKKKVSFATIALFAVLILMVLAGVAVINRNVFLDPSLAQELTPPSGSTRTENAPRPEVRRYRETIAGLVAASDTDAYRMERALAERNVRTIANAVSTANHDRLLEKLQTLQAPGGLKTAQALLESGITERKAVAAAISNALSGADTVDPVKTLQRLKAADGKVRKAVSTINNMERAE